MRTNSVQTSGPLMMPIRVQRKRSKGFRLPPNTISVCRPGRFGNPFRVEDLLAEVREKVALTEPPNQKAVQQAAQQLAVERFEQGLQNPESLAVDEAIKQRFRWMRSHLDLLKRKNLACFCPLLTSSGEPNPCHVDVLLVYSNQPLTHKSEST